MRASRCLAASSSAKCSSRFASARRRSTSSLASSLRCLASALARSSAAVWRSKEVCEEEGESQAKRGRVEDVDRRCGRSPTTAPTDGTRAGRGRSSTMIGRDRDIGELGAVNVWTNVRGGVRGVGGASTMMIRSFLCSRFGSLRDDSECRDLEEC